METTYPAGYYGDRGGTKDHFERTIIIPAYNEEQRIGPTLDKYLGHFDDHTEIMVVLNGCHDRTLDVVVSFMDSHPNLRIVHEPGVRGKGGAVARGFTKARGDLVAYADADCAFMPDQIELLMQEVGDYDGAMGSRWLQKSLGGHTQTFVRSLASKTFSIVVRAMFDLPYRDTQCGAKVFKQEAVQAVAHGLLTTNLAFDVEILYMMHKRGFKVREVPIMWEDKEGSSIRLWRHGPLMLGTLLWMWLKHTHFGSHERLGESH